MQADTYDMFPYLLILATLGKAAMVAAPHPDAVTLYECGFEKEADEDYDNWPDGWARKRGEGFPHYLPIEIAPEAAVSGGHSLRFDLDGAAATAYSPAIGIDPRHDYVLHASLCVRQLVYDRAWLSIIFLDEKRQPLETIDSEKFGVTEGWQPVRLGPVRASNPAVRWAKIALRLEPGAKADLRGTAMFDDIWFAQVPRLEAQIVESHLLYPSDEPITVRCRVSGYRNAPPDVRLELSDALDEVLVRHALSLRPVTTVTSLMPGRLNEDYLVAEADWKLPVAEPGYYRLRATVSHDGLVLYERELRLAVADQAARPEHGEFGWTLPRGEQTLSLSTLAQWASQASVYWIKFPLWYDDQDQARVSALTRFADRLNSQGIGLVGILCDPPPETRRLLAIAPGSPVANLFTQDASLWYASLEPVMARLSLKVRWWQLGYDTDSSLSGIEDPAATVRRVKKRLDEIGQNVHVGVVWNWIDTVPTGKNAPWSFVSRSSEPTLAPDELTAYLAATRAVRTQWISLDPLDPERYDAATRAADLVLRLVAAKEQSVEQIFFNDPLHSQSGLVREDGSASELLLPWRTAARALGGATYLGRLDLPGGSDSRVFIRGNQVVAAVWNSAVTNELIDCGEQVHVSDLWGRVRDVADGPQGRMLEVGPLPQFVSGLDEAIVRWRMSVAIDRDRLPSVTGTPHYAHVKWRNFFDQSVGGTLRIVAPAGWRVTPEQVELKMAAGETAHQKLELVVPSTASCGHEWLQFNFDLQAEEPHRFSVRRPIELGLGDVYLELSSHLNGQGELEVEQRLINRTEERVNFRCHLSIPDRRRMRTQVFKLPAGEDVQTYRIPGGEELLGQTLRVQAEEVGGKRRNLNYTFTAEP
ncbi:MAG TPA: NEW3 domain-containing protein [Pirellulales bacterium]|nr:NEW3 domain-containing protein [Pirellulales bacterium]